MPANTPREIELPEAGYPMVTRVVSAPVLKLEGDGRLDWTWQVGESHPLVPNLRIVRMFYVDHDVQVYAVTADGVAGTRYTIPQSLIRLVEESMPIDVFVVELEASEEEAPGTSEDPEDPENLEEGQAPPLSPPPSPIHSVSNNQT